MKIVLDAVTKGDSLPETSLSFENKAVTIVGVETSRRPTVLGLVASGRMRPVSGNVLVDHVVNYGKIRAAIALVDAPDVSEPNDDVTLAGVTAEELMFAGRASGPWAVGRALRGFGVDEYAHTSMADLPPAVRIHILCELALLRPGVRGLVLTSPDRHGGDPADWLAYANELASRGLAILVIVGRAHVPALPEIAAHETAADETAADAAPAEASTAEPTPAEPTPAEPEPVETPPATWTPPETATPAETAAPAAKEVSA